MHAQAQSYLWHPEHVYRHRLKLHGSNLGAIIALTSIHDQRGRTMKIGSLQNVARIDLGTPINQHLHCIWLTLTRPMQRFAAVTINLVGLKIGACLY